MTTKERVSVLRLILQGVTVGFLAGYQGGRNILSFSPEFRENGRRPTLSLVTHPDFPGASQQLARPWVSHQRLHPVLSNMLPEGPYREDLAQSLKIHVDNEFPLLSYLGGDLPGALIAVPLEPSDIPGYALEHRPGVEPVSVPPARSGAFKFSLAGVQSKFSMRQRDGTYHIPSDGELGDWIVKPPSPRHAFVPLNEFTAMSLAQSAGVDIPDIKLVPVAKLTDLPSLNLPAEEYAYAVRRFDREEQSRTHIEDFAQVLLHYAHDKYGSANYEQIGKVLYQFTGRSLANAQQFARRLLVNILLANGDAHLKNWSLIYPDSFTPELAPAYDIVTTRAYIQNEREFALKLGKTKNWYEVGLAHFQSWAERAQIPWRTIKPHLEDTLDKARTLWPRQLTALPMAPAHKELLVTHWRQLHKDFQIGNEIGGTKK
jgi:serine/threonine-protein kinase HipA